MDLPRNGGGHRRSPVRSAWGGVRKRILRGAVRGFRLRPAVRYRGNHCRGNCYRWSCRDDRIEQLCQRLNLPAIASQWSHYAQQTLGQDGSYADFVEAILTHEYAARQQRSQQVLMKLSGLPQVKTLEDYDFNYALRKPLNHR